MKVIAIEKARKNRTEPNLLNRYLSRKFDEAKAGKDTKLLHCFAEYLLYEHLDYELSKKISWEIVKIDNKDVNAWLRLGDILWEYDRNQIAAENAYQIANTYAKNSFACVSLAQFYNKTKNYWHAEFYFNRALLKGNEPLDKISFALFLAQRERHAEAAILYEGAKEDLERRLSQGYDTGDAKLLNHARLRLTEEFEKSGQRMLARRETVAYKKSPYRGSLLPIDKARER